MKDIKLKERLEKVFEALFEDEKLNENNSFEYVPHETALPTNETAFFSENTSKILTVLRQLFLFLPSSFLLFLASVGLTVRFILVYGEENVVTISFIEIVVLLGIALTTILGLGDLRNPKHFTIPLSIISIGVILGVIGTVFFDFFGFGYFLFNYAPYFFPLALIIPILAKNWADDSDDK